MCATAERRCLSHLLAASVSPPVPLCPPSASAPHSHWPLCEDIQVLPKAPPGPCHPLQPLSHQALPDGLGSGILEHSVCRRSRAF